jgi:hypothetical protein
VPRRARRLVPAGVPRRAELVAAAVVTVILLHLLLAPLTLMLVLLFAMISRITRWRPGWLLVPAVAGIAWMLAAGPTRALAGFAAEPAVILAHLSARTAARGHRPGSLGGIGGWLPRQLPVALPLAAGEAALLGWLHWLRTDEWAVPPRRPGALAALRAAVTARAVGAGAVLTRDGCALGVVPGTGAVAELSWAEMASGGLVAGAAEREVMLASLQVVHAALRRRKPVIVLDDGPGTAVAGVLVATCRATGTPLLAGDALLSGDVLLGRAISERVAVLLPAGTPELATRACAALTTLAADLRRIGVDGDALAWVPHGERVPAPALGALLRAAPGTGLAVLIGTTSPAAAAELCELAGLTLVRRLTDPELAARLAARTGTRLLPPAVAAGRDGSLPPGAVPPAAGPAELVRCPVVPAGELLTLGPADFVLARGGPRQRLVTRGQLVPARLPA